MKLIEVRWTPYAVPFAGQFETAQGIWRTREGAILRIRTEGGTTGIGEIAPLSSHGMLPLHDQLSALERLASCLIGAEVDDLAARIDDAFGDGAAFAPLRCAIETAALDAAARDTGQPLASLLSSSPASHVNLNTVIDTAGAPEAAAAAARAVAAGFRTVKLKVGAASSIAGEAARVAALRDAIGPDVGLRLDANGAWTEERAIETLRSLAPCAIELVEQPMAAHEIDALARVRRAVPMPIAADEGVTSRASARALIDAGAVDALVLKLPVVGGPLRAMGIARMAHAAGIQVIVTSALDTGIGIAVALHVAAALPQPGPACGLATLELLADGLIQPGLPIESGNMRVPSGPGLGVAIDEQELARYAAGEERVVRA